MAYPKNIGELGAVNANTGNQGVLPQNQVAMFTGENSKTFDPVAEALARSMEQQGYSSKEIYQSTGLFRNQNSGAWNTYMPDYATKLNPDLVDPGYVVREGGVPIPRQDATMGDLLMNREDLFKSYPDLAKVKVNFFDEGPNSLGYYNGAANEFGFTTNPSVREGYVGYAPGQNPEEIANVLHEIQHYIRGQEGELASGANAGGNQGTLPYMYQELLKRATEDVNKSNVPVIPDTYYEFGIVPTDNLNPTYSPFDEKPKEIARTAFSSYLNSKNFPDMYRLDPEELIHNNPSPDTRHAIFDAYQRLTGEADARATEGLYKNAYTYQAGGFNPTTSRLFNPNVSYSGIPFNEQINRNDVYTMPLYPQKTPQVSDPDEQIRALLSSVKSYPQLTTPSAPTTLPERTEPIIPTPRTGINPYTGDATPSAMNNTLPSNGGRDTSWDRPDIYSEPAGPSMDDMGEEPTGGAYSSTYNAREKRGGRIR